MLQLDSTLIIGSGEDRVVYAHPQDSSLCIKITRLDFEKEYILSTLRDYLFFISRGGNKRFFDYNYIDRLYAKKLDAKANDEVWYRHIPKCYGSVETNLGTGVVWQRIRNHDGSDCMTLRQTLMSPGQLGKDEKTILRNCLNEFFQWQLDTRIMLRESAFTNTLVCSLSSTDYRLYHIDAIGCADLIPLADYVGWIRYLRVCSKVRSFRGRVMKRWKTVYKETFINRTEY